MPRSARPAALTLEIRNGAGRTSTRLAAEIVRAIADGLLRDNDPMPSTRTLAANMGVARSVVVDAYQELSVNGLLRSTAGSGTVVEFGAEATARSQTMAGRTDLAVSADDVDEVTESAKFDLTPSYADAGLLDRRAWNSAWRTALGGMGGVVPDVTGDAVPRNAQRHHTLRVQLAELLRTTQAVVCNPADIFVFPHLATAMLVLVDALSLRDREIVVEDPSCPRTRAALSQVCRVRPVPIDGQGLDPDMLDEDCAMVVVAAAHQFPLGSVMPPRRRALLVEWARDNDAVIFEDDYDGPYRYGVPPVPGLRSQPGGEEHVIHLGTSESLIEPGLNVAWAVVPARLRAPIERHLQLFGDPTSTTVSDAFAEFIRGGNLTRHLASATRVYAARRRRFVEACARHLPTVPVIGDAVGLHVTLIVPGIDDVACADALRRRGLLVSPLSPHFAEADDAATGLVCGFGRLPETRAEPAAILLGEVLDSFRKPP